MSTSRFAEFSGIFAAKHDQLASIELLRDRLLSVISRFDDATSLERDPAMRRAYALARNLLAEELRSQLVKLATLKGRKVVPRRSAAGVMP